MRRKCKVVESDRRRKSIVACCILAADDGGIEESRVEYEVCEEPKDVDYRKFDGGTLRGTTAVVENRLWIEGCRPADSIYPAESIRH